MVQLRIQLLGEIAVFQNGVNLLSGRRNTRAMLLLAYLLLQRGKQLNREYLAAIFWPDSKGEQARTNLRGALIVLREQAPELAACLEDRRPHLGWRIDCEHTVDVFEFEAMLGRAEALAPADVSAAIAALKQSVSLYTGELLPGIYDEWVLGERNRLHTTYLNALLWLAELLEASGQIRDAIRYAELLLRADRLRETSHLLLMRLLAATGDRARALRCYADCARLLLDELGANPGPAIEALHRRLLQEDEAASATPPPRAPVTAPVGRTAAWEQLTGSWRKAAAGEAQIVVLTGEAGIGKTWLAQVLIEWCAAQDAVALAASCPLAREPAAYGALAQWLASPRLALRLARLDEEDLTFLQLLSPELRRRYPALRPAAPLTPPWQRLRLQQALASLFIDDQAPTLLFLDEAQWCDEQSLEWLHYLFAAHPNARLLVVLAMHTGEAEDRPLTLTRAALLAKGHLQQIDLSRLSFAETAQLAQQTATRPLDSQTIARLYAASAGNPFFVVELVRMMESEHAARDAAGSDPPGEIATLPTTISALILHRLALLSPPSRQLLEAAAVIGAHFAAALLAKVDRLTEDARIHVLDELCRRTLLVKASGDFYAFAHGLVCEVIYAQLSEVRRRHLHQQVAAALIELHASELASVADQIAGHYERAERHAEAAQFRAKGR